MADQLFYGSLYGMPQGNSSNSVIRISGNINGNTITGVTVAGYLGLESVAVGMVVRWGSNTRTVTAVNVGSFDVDGAAITAAATFRISPAEGNYYVSASVFSDPNNEITVNNITGSLNDDFDSVNDTAFAVLAAADGVNGRFHQYKITQVVTRSLGDSKISFFMDWNESGSEAGSGDTLATNLQYMGIGEVTNRLGISPTFNRRVGDLTNLQVGADQAGFQVVAQALDDFSTGSFTGSFHGEFSGSFTGSGHITLANTASSADDFRVRGDLTVIGTGSFGFIHTLYQSASIIHSSGSTKFGDTNDDTHQFTGSLSSEGGLVDFTRATEVEGDFSGSFRGDGNGLTNLEFNNVVNKPTLLSSSAQIADDISGSFVATSASIASDLDDVDTRITNVSSSLNTRITNVSSSLASDIEDVDTRVTTVSSSIDTRITNVSSSASTRRNALNTRITNVSASFSTSETALSSSISSRLTSVSASSATDLSSLSSSIASDIEDIIDGTTTTTSASFAITASYVREQGLEQDVRITGSLEIQGDGSITEPSLRIVDGFLTAEGIPFYSHTGSVAASLPTGSIYSSTFLLNGTDQVLFIKR